MFWKSGLREKRLECSPIFSKVVVPRYSKCYCKHFLWVLQKFYKQLFIELCRIYVQIASKTEMIPLKIGRKAKTHPLWWLIILKFFGFSLYKPMVCKTLPYQIIPKMFHCRLLAQSHLQNLQCLQTAVVNEVW